MPKGMGFTARKLLLVNPWDVKSAPAESRRYILALKCKVLRRFFITEDEPTPKSLSISSRNKYRQTYQLGYRSSLFPHAVVVSTLLIGATYMFREASRPTNAPEEIRPIIEELCSNPYNGSVKTGPKKLEYPLNNGNVVEVVIATDILARKTVHIPSLHYKKECK